MMELPPGETIRQTAQQVLSDDNYRLVRSEDPFAPFWSRLLDGLLWLLKQFVDFVNSIEVLPPVLRWVVVSAMLALLVVLMSHIIYTLFRTAQPAVIPRGSFQAKLRTSLDPAEFEQAASQLAQQGRLIEAIRCLLKAALIRIEASHKRPFRQSTTNRQYLRKYRSLPVLQPVQTLVEQIDRSWYGEQPCETDDFSRCEQAHRSIVNNLQQSSHD